MGNYKFKFPDMIPNVWFYKLKNINKVKNQHKTTKNHQLSSPIHPHLSKITNQPQLSHQRKSYHFKRDLTDNFLPKSPIKNKKIPVEPLRKSSRRRSTKKNRLVSSSISAGCSCHTTIESVWTKPPPEYSTQEEYLISHSPDQNSSSQFDFVFNEYDSDRDRTVTPDMFNEMLSFSTKCKCNSQNDIVIEIDTNINPEFGDSVTQLTPIKTNKQHPINVQKMSTKSLSVSSQSYEKLNLSESVRIVKEDLLLRTVKYPTLKGNETGNMKAHICTRTTTKTRSFIGNSSSPGLKLRMNSPRIADRRIQGGRKSGLGSQRCNISKSFAVVKSSRNPERDFRESMLEMIVENNIKASKDLEELLACYLSLNSNEYHDLIINVFKQIWFDFVRVRTK